MVVVVTEDRGNKIQTSTGIHPSAQWHQMLLFLLFFFASSTTTTSSTTSAASIASTSASSPFSSTFSASSPLRFAMWYGAALPLVASAKAMELLDVCLALLLLPACLCKARSRRRGRIFVPSFQPTYSKKRLKWVFYHHVIEAFLLSLYFFSTLRMLSLKWEEKGKSIKFVFRLFVTIGAWYFEFWFALPPIDNVKECEGVDCLGRVAWSVAVDPAGNFWLWQASKSEGKANSKRIFCIHLRILSEH